MVRDRGQRWPMLTAFALTVSASCSSPAGNGDNGELLIEAHGPLSAGCTASLFVARAVKSPALSCKNPYGCNHHCASDRPSPAGRGMNIWTARRASTALPFTAPVVVPELSTDADEVPGWLSPDGCRLYHTRNDFGTRHIYLDVHLP